MRKKEERPYAQRTASLQWTCKEKRACSREARETRKALIDWCYQVTGLSGGTGRSGTRECAASRFYSFCRGPHKEDTVHRHIEGKRWRSSRRLQDQLCEHIGSAHFSVPSLPHVGAIFEISTGPALFRHLADQSGVKLEKETIGHLYLSLVKIFSSPIWGKRQLNGLQAAAQVLESPRNKDSTICQPRRSEGQVN